MATTEFIAAIELGSSKITGIAGKKNSDGSMQILAYAQEDSSTFIHKGVVYNPSKTAQCLTTIINILEGELNGHIAKAYVGIAGQSLRTVQNVIVRDFDEVTTISQELVDAISDENIEIPLVDMDILDVIPQEYKVGNYIQPDPVGVACSHVEGRFLNIVARAAVKKNLEKCFELAKIDIADIIIAPLATAAMVLNETERRSGCALIDLGADTTTVSVYKNNILRYMSVIPLGGRNITRDLTTLQIEEDEAEHLKLTYGNATYEEEVTDTPATCTLDDSTRTVELAVLNNIVEARLEEIIANVWNQIQQSGYDDKLLSGLVLTGGAANLKNIEAAFRKQCKIDKVRIARAGRLSAEADGDILRKDGTQNGVLGLLFEGKDNCGAPEPEPVQKPEPVVVEPVVVEQPKPAQPAEPVNLFDDDEALKEQEEQAREARRIKEEEERRRREELKRQKEEEKRKKEEERKRKKKGPGIFERMLGGISDSIFSDDETK